MKKYIPPHPGEVLREYIEEDGIVSKDLCKQIGFSEKHLSQILNKKCRITADFAVKLAKFSGIHPSYWVNLQANYDLAIAAKKLDYKL